MDEWIFKREFQMRESVRAYTKRFGSLQILQIRLIRRFSTPCTIWHLISIGKRPFLFYSSIHWSSSLLLLSHCIVIRISTFYSHFPSSQFSLSNSCNFIYRNLQNGRLVEIQFIFSWYRTSAATRSNTILGITSNLPIFKSIQLKKSLIDFDSKNIQVKSGRPLKMISRKIFLLDESGECVTCSKHADFYCERCGDTYCSNVCQVKDWREHRRVCFPMP